MGNKLNKFEFIYGAATLIGTIIGAGVFAIPYAMSKAGFITGLINLFVLGMAVLFLNLVLGEIVLRTRKKHQLTGYADKYLGSTGRRLMTFSLIFVVYGALIAYLIGIGKSLSAVFGMQHINLVLFGMVLNFDVIFAFLFFVFGSSIIYLGITGVEKSELFMSSIIIFLILLISAISISGFTGENVMSLGVFDVSKIFLPYGVILFALAGAIAVPEIGEEINDKKQFRTAVILGTLLPAFLYFLFSFAIVGICGSSTSEIAIVCLANKFGTFMLLFGNIFVVFAMATSFLSLGLGLKEMYNYDYKMKNLTSWILACFVPLILFILLSLYIKQEKFFSIIDLTGGIAMTLQGILIVLMFKRAKRLGERKPEYSIKDNKFVSAAIIVIFLLGMIFTVLDFLGKIKF